MSLRDAKSMHGGRRAAGGLMVAILILSGAGTASAAPAGDEYGARLPDARGKAGQGAIVPEPEELPPSVRRQLKNSPDRETLTAIATADELGAPEPRELASDDDADGRGLLGAAISGLTHPLGIVAILGLAAIAAAVTLLVRGRAARAS